MKDKKSLRRKINRILEIPEEIMLDESKITISGFNQMLIENYKGILEYEDIFIRISTSAGIVNISGVHLNLNEMTKDDILISGTIEEIELERTEV